MARAGWRILLVDGDLRRPSLHKVFGMENRAGLGDVLRGKVNLREVVQPGPVAGLWVIPGGQANSDSMRSLAQGGMKGLFDGVKAEYDFIILDSAPVLPVVDSQLMAQAVDGVLLSVLQDVSRLPRVYAAYERLMLFQVDLLGVVVHSSSFGAYDSRYPYLPLDAAKEAEAEAEVVAKPMTAPETSAVKAE
jgi:polysaccharide biosynthesis transport protein